MNFLYSYIYISSCIWWW